MAKYLAMKQICDLLQVTERTIYNYIKDGMPAYKMGRDWRFIESEVDGWLKAKQEFIK